MYRHTDEQTHKSTDTDVQTHRCTDTKNTDTPSFENNFASTRQGKTGLNARYAAKELISSGNKNPKGKSGKNEMSRRILKGNTVEHAYNEFRKGNTVEHAYNEFRKGNTAQY